MKIIIDTQHEENYGAHAWDGKGECPQYWKFKGGSTYVVDNLSVPDVMDFVATGIDPLLVLIEDYNDSFKEYIIDWRIADDDAVEGEEWETPVRISRMGDKYVARRTISNDEYGYMRQEIASKTEQWDMLPAGGRANYSATYTMRNGATVKEQSLNAALAA
jgi:hypothetical protein